MELSSFPGRGDGPADSDMMKALSGAMTAGVVYLYPESCTGVPVLKDILRLYDRMN